MVTRLLVVALAMLAAPLFSVPLRAEHTILFRTVVTVQVRPGVTVKYLAMTRTGLTNQAAVILFAGGDGLLNLGPKGTIGNLAGNFLVRSRQLFADRGLFVAVVATPNQLPIDGNVRLSFQYASDSSAVIEHVRKRSVNKKVWLVGTSSGTLSAAGVASHLPQGSPLRVGRPDGVVLTATQTTLVPKLCGRTVFNANLAAINVPVLIASHEKDGCQCSPAMTAEKVRVALTGAKAKQSIVFSGGKPPTSPDPCQAMTPHGFLGIEEQVVANIAKWIMDH